MEIKISEDARLYKKNLKNIMDKYEKEIEVKNSKISKLIE